MYMAYFTLWYRGDQWKRSHLNERGVWTVAHRNQMNNSVIEVCALELSVDHRRRQHQFHIFEIL